jgi:hypothetical protein
VNHLGFDPYALTIGEVLPMRFSARATLATSCVALLSTAACSDSTGPSTSTQSAARLAAHFDSLYVQANSLARGGSLWYAVRAGFLSDLERPLAVGAVPTDVTVTTATGVEHWKGVELLDVFSRGTFLDSGYALVAYRDPDAHTLLFATFASDGSAEVALLLTNDTLGVFQDHTTGVTARTALGGGCATPSGRLRNPSVSFLAAADCTAATFTTSLTLSLLSLPGADSASVIVSFSAASFSGVRLTSQPPTTRRVHALVEQLQRGRRL